MVMAIAKLKTSTPTVLDGKVKVRGGRLVSRKLYMRVAQDVTDRFPSLVAGRLYRLEDIYGKEDWLKLGDGFTRRLAGSCFAHMVSIARFPLKFRQYKRSRTRWYLLLTRNPS